MVICAIIVNYNDYETTSRLVKSIKDFRILDRIIVVDNCSTNNSVEMLKKIDCAKVDIIPSPKNGGYSFGNNIGIRHAMKTYRPEYIVFANPDIHVKEETIRRIIDAFDENDSIGSCITLDKNEVFDRCTAWKFMQYKDILKCATITTTKVFKNHFRYDSEHYSESKTYVDVISGSFFIANMKKMVNVGLFDENTFLFYEESILCKKMREKKYKVFVLSNCSYIHEHQTTINKVMKNDIKKYLVNQKSARYYLSAYCHTNMIGVLFFDFITALGVAELAVKNLLKKKIIQ